LKNFFVNIIQAEKPNEIYRKNLIENCDKKECFKIIAKKIIISLKEKILFFFCKKMENLFNRLKLICCLKDSIKIMMELFLMKNLLMKFNRNLFNFFFVNLI
jgi:hypothetical protein